MASKRADGLLLLLLLFSMLLLVAVAVFHGAVSNSDDVAKM